MRETAGFCHLSAPRSRECLGRVAEREQLGSNLLRANRGWRRVARQGPERDARANEITTKLFRMLEKLLGSGKQGGDGCPYEPAHCALQPPTLNREPRPPRPRTCRSLSSERAAVQQQPAAAGAETDRAATANMAFAAAHRQL